MLRLLKGDGHAARIQMPFATFRKLCYNKKGSPSGNWDLLEKLGQPEVIVLIDEVTEVYKAARDKLAKAVDALRAKYSKCTEANITVFGMSVALSQDFFFLPLRILLSIFFYFPSHALDFSHIFPQMCIWQPFVWL